MEFYCKNLYFIILFAIFGILLSFSTFLLLHLSYFGVSVRTENINLYNQFAEYWSYGKTFNMGFTYFYEFKNTEKIRLELNQNSTGSYYPYRDKKRYKSDPEFIESSPLYYSNEIDIDSFDNDKISYKIKTCDRNFVCNATYHLYNHNNVPLQKIIIENETSLNCQNNNCINICNDKNGIWNDNNKTCSITNYLCKICYRIYIRNYYFTLPDTNMYYY